MNLATNLEWSAFFFPDQPVISEGNSVTSYARLNRQANRVATALLGLNIQPGDQIGIFAPNSGDWIAFYFGVLKAGAVPVTLSSQLSRDELSVLLNHCQPRMIFTTAEKLDILEGFRAPRRFGKDYLPRRRPGYETTDRTRVRVIQSTG